MFRMEEKGGEKISNMLVFVFMEVVLFKLEKIKFHRHFDQRLEVFESLKMSLV